MCEAIQKIVVRFVLEMLNNNEHNQLSAKVTLDQAVVCCSLFAGFHLLVDVYESI